MIDIALLGTSALQPLPNRYLAAAMLSCAGRQLLFDCGEGTQAAIRAAGMGLIKIDMIALTHYHGDHIFGLPGLLQSMGMAGRTEKLFITGPEGLESELAPFRAFCAYLPFEVQLLTLPSEGLCLGKLLPIWPKEARLFAFPTCHHCASQGYRFELAREGKFDVEKALALKFPKNFWGKLQHGEKVEWNGETFSPSQVLGSPRKGLSFAYTGDTALTPELSQAVSKVDLLISEATYGENDQEAVAVERGHMTFSQAAHLAVDAGAGELWLTHYSPAISEPESYLPNAASIFANTRCGADGMTKTMHFTE